MTIKEAQEVVDNWIKTYGVRYFNELTNMAQLTEEVGEVARIIARRYGEHVAATFKWAPQGGVYCDCCNGDSQLNGYWTLAKPIEYFTFTKYNNHTLCNNSEMV